MRSAGAVLRLTAIVLITMLCVTFAAPARAEADVLWAVGIAGLVVVAVIVVVYLIVASSRGPKMPVEAQPMMLACVESDLEARSCWPMSGPLVVPMPAPATSGPEVAIPMAPMEAVPQS